MLGGEQVLVCPDCQVEGWTDGLDVCATCGSTMLVKQLGAVSCRACGSVGEPTAGPAGSAAAAGSATDELTVEVAQALERVLGRPPADG